MAEKDIKVLDENMIVPSIFDILDDEELNPPSYTGKDFIGQNVIVLSYAIKKHDTMGDFVEAVIFDPVSERNLPCAFFSWHCIRAFKILLEKNISPPFSVGIVPDGKSYKFSQTIK